MLERHDDFSIFHSNLMNFNYFLYDSVSEYFNWNLSYYFSWDSSFNFNLFWHLLLDYQLNWLLSLYDLDLLDIFNDRPIHIDFLNDFNFPDNRNFSDNFDNLQTGYFNSDDSFDNSWNFNDLFDDSWNRNNFFNNPLNLNNSRYLNNLFNNLVHKDSLSPNDLSFDDDRYRHFNSNLLNDLLSHWNDSGDLLVDNSGFRLNVWHLHFHINWLFLLEIQWHNFFYFQVFCDQELLSVWLFDNNFNFLNNLLPIAFDEMCHLYKNFFLDLSNDFFFLNNWHFDNPLFNDLVRNDFFNNLSHIDFAFFSVGDKTRNFPVEVDSLSVSDYMGHLTFNLYVSVSLEDLLIDNFNFFNSISCFSNIDWLLHYLLDLDVLLLARNLYWFFNLNELSSLNDNLLVTLNFDNLLLI